MLLQQGHKLPCVFDFIRGKPVVRNRQAALAEKYRNESRTDALTGLNNKGAYIQKEEELTRKLLKSRKEGDEFTFAIVSLDLNNLKKVNDNHGHEDGDRFIQNAARILKESVGENGETYRVGDDEFLAIIYGEDPETLYQSAIKDLNDKIAKFNETEKSDYPLSFAYGHAICTSGQNYSIHDYERIADAEMYDCKHRMKAER